MEEIRSPIKAIRAFCLECCGGSAPEVRGCTSKSCVLKPFRFGKNPYTRRKLTDEQKVSNAARLEEARRRKKQSDMKGENA